MQHHLVQKQIKIKPILRPTRERDHQPLAPRSIELRGPAAFGQTQTYNIWNACRNTYYSPHGRSWNNFHHSCRVYRDAMGRRGNNFHWLQIKWIYVLLCANVCITRMDMDMRRMLHVLRYWLHVVGGMQSVAFGSRLVVCVDTLVKIWN